MARFALAFLLMAGAAALAAPLAGATVTRTELHTWPTGGDDLVLDFPDCSSPDNSSWVRLPADANIIRFSFHADWNPSPPPEWTPSTPPPGTTLTVDIGDDGNPRTQQAFSTYDLPDYDFENYLEAQSTGGEDVTVPIMFDGCNPQGPLKVRLTQMVLSYEQGTPVGSEYVVIHGPVPWDVTLDVNTTNENILDLSPYASDGDGQPLTFSIANCGWWQMYRCYEDTNLSIWLNGTWLAASSRGGWIGTAEVSVYVFDTDYTMACICQINVTTIPVADPNRVPRFVGNPLSNHTFPVMEGQTQYRTLNDLGPMFSDEDGEALALSVWPDPRNLPGSGVNLRIDGSALKADISQPNESVGLFCFRVKATDPHGSYAFSNPSCIRVFGPGVPPPPPVITAIEVGGAVGGTVTAGVPLDLSVQTDIEISPDTTVEWLLDGAPLASGATVDNVTFTAGAHTLEVRVSTPTGNAKRAVFFTAVAPALPPAEEPAIGGPGSGAFAYVTIAAASVAVGVGTLVFSIDRARYLLLTVLFVPLFTRLRKERLLDHFGRGRLYQLILDEPGITFSDLRRRTGLSNGSAVHHLRLLEKGGYIRGTSDGVSKRFSVTEIPLEDDSYGFNATEQAILDAVSTTPGLSEGDLSKQLAKSLSTVSRAVEKLAARGHVTTKRNGRTVAGFIRPSAQTEAPADS